jgi:hypothetical protein
LSKILGIYDIAVMGYSESVRIFADYDGLSVAYAAGACSGITVVSYGNVSALELAKRFFAEDLGNQTHLCEYLNFITIGSRNAGTFLAAVLQSE